MRLHKENMTVQVGDDLGAFHLVELLGVGGMGTVYRAVHRDIERQVAIKVLNPEFCDRPDIVRRFFREAQVVNQIHHRNIVDVTDLIEPEDGPPYIIMELLEGETLTYHISHNAPINVETCAELALQITDALSKVHAAGIVHRDLKPDNIFLVKQNSGSMKAKLLDFGIAKFLATEDSFLKTATGQAIGTPEYMAPEQLQGLQVDQRADIYSMGAVLYSMLTGKPPFASSDLNVLIFKHLNETPRPPSQMLTDTHSEPIPPAIDDLVMRCLAKDSDYRVQTMEQLSEILACVLMDDVHTMVVAPISSPPKQRRWLWGVAAAGLLGLVGLTIWGAGLGGSRSGGNAAHELANRRKPRPASAMSGPTRRIKRQVELLSVPSGAEIYRAKDGQHVGRTPKWVAVTKEQKFLLRLKGYEPATATVGLETPSPFRLALAKKSSAAQAAEKPPPGPSPMSSRRSRRRKTRDRSTLNPFK
jgi:serine/threonine protein kinase